MTSRNSSLLVFALVIGVLFALLYVSGSTQSISPNEPRIVQTESNSNLSSSCISVDHYESLFETDAPMLGLPSYLPNGYALQCINVSGPNPSEEDAVSFYYFKDDSEFQSKFLPKIERNETEYHPMYAKWISEYYDAGGIVITRSLEYIEEDDPRYNDKLKHAEIERAIGDPLNECSLPEFTRGNCEPPAVENPPIKFADGNPVVLTNGIDRNSGNSVNSLLMYLDHNWLVWIVGPSDSDELFSIAESIHQKGGTETNVATGS